MPANLTASSTLAAHRRNAAAHLAASRSRRWRLRARRVSGRPDPRVLAVGVAGGDIYLQPLAGGPARRLTKRSQQLNGLVWASNREILFYSTAGVSGSMWRMAADGRSEQQPVAGALDGAVEPAISHPPNGPARLAYTRFVGDSNIWRMAIALDAHGGVRAVGQPASIIASTRADMSPRFSPDGKRIVFASDRDGYSEIWVAASDGSGPRS